MAMRKTSLTSLYERYERRSLSLTQRFDSELPTSSEERIVCEPVHRDGRAYLIARIQHLWGEFCRELIVKSAIGGCETRAGRVLSHAPGIKRVVDVPRITKTPLAGNRSSWEDPQFSIGQARLLKVSNFNEIGLGLGGASGVIDNIRYIRNYIIHPNSRNSVRYLNVARLLGFGSLPPVQLVSQTTTGGETVFENWLSTLTLAAWNAVA